MFFGQNFAKICIFYKLLAFYIINSATHAQIASTFASLIVTLGTTSEMLSLKMAVFIVFQK